KGAEQTVTLKIGEHLAHVPTAALGSNPIEGQPTSPSVNSAYFLRRMNPAAEIRIENQSGVNTWRPGRGRLALDDDQGLLVIDILDGHRVLSARNPKGEVIFEGPIDNDEQRNAVPEPIRARLKILEAQQREAPSPA